MLSSTTNCKRYQTGTKIDYAACIIHPFVYDKNEFQYTLDNEHNCTYILKIVDKFLKYNIPNDIAPNT